MQSMSVRPEQVNALAAQIRSGSQGIRSELDRLESEAVSYTHLTLPTKRIV